MRPNIDAQQLVLIKKPDLMAVSKKVHTMNISYKERNLKQKKSALKLDNTAT